MRYIGTLSERDKKDLTSLFKHHNSHSVRRRAHTVLLSAERFTVGEIAHISGRLLSSLRFLYGGKSETGAFRFSLAWARR